MELNTSEIAFLEKQLLTIQKLANSESTNNLKMISELARVGYEELQKQKVEDEEDKQSRG